MDDEEDYVFFGTPLPEIEDEATLKKKAAKEQQVRDEKGRQRFHGAFTGGFSAGYFNTVGTKEGWAPSTFVSSRNKIADRVQQNPEDFMDDEDFGEFGIATRKVHTTANFQEASSDKSLQKRKYIDTDAVIPGEAPLKDIVQPVRESIGIAILRKLGWRPGQGIGPRVKKHSVGTKVYGCSPFPDVADPEEEDPIAAAFTFAPKDTEAISYQPKDNYFGLGYTGLSKKSVLGASVDPFAPTSTKSWLAKDKKKLKISGQAFGVGAFEEEDEDIYGKDDMSQYDFSDLTVKGSEDSHKAIEAPKHVNLQDVLEGFCLASQPPVLKKHYPPPELPPNFKPIHLKNAPCASQNVNLSQSHHTLSASDRSLLLGEKKFQKVSLNVPNTTEEKRQSRFEHVQPMPSTSSSSSSSNFRPFPNDLSKQQRYEEYLRLKQIGEVRKLVQPSTMTEWEKEQEIEEFARASTLFKPLSNELSSRFESRSHLSVEHEVMSALEKLKKKKEEKKAVIKKSLVGTSNRKTFEWHPDRFLCKRMNVCNPYPDSDFTGTLNVPETKSIFEHLTSTPEKAQSPKKSDSSVPASSSSLEYKIEESNKSTSDEVNNQSSDTAVPVKNNDDVLSENKKPPMDFFKDIFENSSSDDDDGGGGGGAVDEKAETSDKLHISEKELSEQKNMEDNREQVIHSQNAVDSENALESSQRNILSSSIVQSPSTSNKKVGFGVFANLDLDALNQRKPSERAAVIDASMAKSEASDVSLTSSSSGRESVDEQPKVDNAYGPELPPNYVSAGTSASLNTPHKVSSKKRGKSKSSHKHKHHKHKHKKKKKKKKKSSKKDSSSSDSSDEELDDIPPALIIEKMKKLQKRKL